MKVRYSLPAALTNGLSALKLLVSGRASSKVTTGLLAVAVMALLAFSVPANAAELDDRIESSAKQSYAFKVYLQSDDVRIQSKDGAVTLTGAVSENYKKSLAQDTVASLPGVKSVDNKLEIKGATPITTPTTTSDAWIREKLKATLLFRRGVSADTTEIAVHDGIVTLTGAAASQAQKELTTEYAKDVDGVKEVINAMTVGKASKQTQTVGGKIDDASITAQVKITLLYHRSTSALNTLVSTSEGVVTLNGKAKNAAALHLATKLASDINGVVAVKNHMSVE